MPALPDVPKVLKCTHVFSVGSDPNCMTRFHFQYAGNAPTNTDCASIAASLFGAWQAGPILSTHPTTILTAVHVVDLTSPTSGANVHVGSVPGTAGGGPLAANTCVLVNFPIQRRYRGGKPRAYVPMGTDTDLGSPNAWASGSVTNFQARMNTYFADAVAITWSGGNIAAGCAVSYYTGHTNEHDESTDRYRAIPTLRPVPIVDLYQGFVVNAKIGTQRRRIRGTGT